MVFEVYHAHLCAACISAIASIFMIIFISFNTSNLNTNLTSQLLILFGLFDILGASSWFLGNKYAVGYTLCSVQEYVFQIANLLKATTTVLISCIAWSVVKNLKSPKLEDPIFRRLMPLLLVPFVFLAINIYFESSKPFCGSSDSDKQNFVYFMAFLPPLYACVLANFWIYTAIKKRTKHIVQFFSVVYRTSPSNIDAQLLAIVSKLRIYPNAFFLCWLPEVVYVACAVFIGKRYLVIGIISGLFINSTGSLVAACTCYQRYRAPSNINPHEEVQRVDNEITASTGLDAIDTASSSQCSSVVSHNPLSIPV